MLRLHRTDDLDHCEELWRAAMPTALVTDLWEFRACFQRHFDRSPWFVYVEEDGSVVGLLPLAWIGELEAYGYFPGETWQERTWIEGNRIHARDEEVLRMLLSACPSNTELRYLLSIGSRPDAVDGEQWATLGNDGDDPAWIAGTFDVDEVGYLFSPHRYEFDLERWFEEFSAKNAKRLRRSISAVESRGVEYRFDEPEDVNRLFALSEGRFATSSYFYDPRFRGAFGELIRWLDESGWLRVATLLIDGQPVAVDVGAVYRRIFTVLAGGTDPGCPGIAKVINLHHLKAACALRYDTVDFLCGDFSWKLLFHLEQRPLYRYDGRSAGRRGET